MEKIKSIGKLVPGFALALAIAAVGLVVDSRVKIPEKEIMDILFSKQI